MSGGYDRLARFWQPLEEFLHGDRLAKTRLCCLDNLEEQQPANVLLVGDGDGRFLVELLHRLPNTRVVSIDRSTSMVALARSRLTAVQRRRVQHVIADATRPAITSPKRFCAVVTHFFFDQWNASRQEEIIAHLDSLLAGRASWHIADYQLPPAGWPRQRARAILFVLYRFFGMLTDIEARRLHNPAPLLESFGFRLASEAHFDRQLLVSASFVRDGLGDGSALSSALSQNTAVLHFANACEASFHHVAIREVGT